VIVQALCSDLTDLLLGVQYKVDIADLGKHTLLPPLLQAAVGAFSGAIADGLIDRGYSVKRTRQILQVRPSVWCTLNGSTSSAQAPTRWALQRGERFNAVATAMTNRDLSLSAVAAISERCSMMCR
jgi:hypothetical protein